MAVQFIQARVTNPGRPGRASASTSERKMRKSRKKIKVLVGRKANPAKKRAKPRKRSLVKRASARVKSLLARLRGSKRPKRRKARKASSKLVVARIANPRKRSLVRRRRNGVARRRHNPAFDVKHALMTGAVLIAGTFVGLKLVPYIESKLAELAPSFFSGKTIGYTMLAGAAITIVGGEYLQKRFGSKKIDLAPAAYAIAAIMAIRGLRKSELVAAEPMLGYHHGMSGTLDFNSDAYGSGYAAPANGMGALPRGYSMLGSIQTADMLPAPPVAPHNVMQGYHGASLI